MGLILGGVSARDLILDSQSVSLYAGGSPPVKVWPTGETRETVRITLGTGYEARDQMWAALADRGLNFETVTEIPFDIELVGSGSTRNMFYGCTALTHVPDLITSQVTNMRNMFQYCAALTDGNVRLIGRHPNVYTLNMISNSGLTREPFYDTNGNPI